MSEKYKFRDLSGIYFVTPTITGWIDLFSKKQYAEIVLDSLKYCQIQKGLVIHAWVIMSNHLHLIISSNLIPLNDIMRDFKKFTSKEIVQQLIHGNDSRKEWILKHFIASASEIKRNKFYKVWQDGNHPVQLDTNNMLDTRLEYLHNNPVKQGWVAKPEDYVYSSAIDYSGGKGLLAIKKIE
ncbi:MAG: transposase [Bacteroidia bacterium]|nr:transposase [Bacteroidia bacterium]